MRTPKIAILLVPVLITLAACSTRGSSPEALLGAQDGVTIYLAEDRLLAPCTNQTVLTLLDGTRIDPVPDWVVLEGDKIGFDSSADRRTLRLRQGDANREIQVSCLPEDFPRIELDGELSQWVVFQSLPLVPGVGSYRVLLDTNGFPRWFEPSTATADVFFHDGDLYRFENNDNAMPAYSNTPGVGFEIADLDGHALVDLAPTTGPGLDHHALLPLPGGTFLGIVYERTVEDLANWGSVPGAAQPNRPCPDKVPGPGTPVLRGRVVEIDSKGNTLRTWRAEDAIAGRQSPEWLNVARPGEQDCVLDPEHLNALSYDPSSDTLLVTGRHLDGAVALRWSTGEVLWSLGLRDGPSPLRILDDPRSGMSRPHDGVLDGSTVSFYDNHPGSVPRVVEYRIDRTARTAALARSLEIPCENVDPCEAQAMGAARKVAGGDRFLVSAGTFPTSAFELDAASGEVHARLRVGSSYLYRVTPLSELERGKVVSALDRRPR